MAGAMSNAMRGGGGTEPAQAPSTQKCVKCGAALQAGAKFCSDCGTSQVPGKCSNCQNELKPGAKFCDECGTKVG
jgi:membrane protease subunit (stomatin/prohibitin family)